MVHVFLLSIIVPTVYIVWAHVAALVVCLICSLFLAYCVGLYHWLCCFPSRLVGCSRKL